MPSSNTPKPSRQRGTTLLEALVAFLVLSLGMLTLTRVQTQLRLNSDVARQRSEAVRLAQEDLETVRAFAVLAASAGARSYSDITSASRTVSPGNGTTNTSYLVTRQIALAEVPHAKAATVTVSWTDRGGAAQGVTLSSIIAGTAPAYSGALGLARSGMPVKGPLARSVRIPLGAKDLGDGRSAFKPVSSGSVAFVFDNRTGLLTARCAGISPTLPMRDLTNADLGSCDAGVGSMLSGVVRFSSASPPDAAQANEVPPAVAVSVTLAGSGYAAAPDCTVEAMKTVSYALNGSLHVEAVPIAATPAMLGLAAWVDTGARHLAYACAMYPSASGQWSGHVSLVPTGWSIGTLATDHRVCRFTSDLDGSGAIDANIEHPANYVGVDSSLPNQNFLVINGSEACPSGRPTQVAGNGNDVFVDLSTLQHQP